MLELRDLVCCYGKVTARARRLAHRRPRSARRPDRRQRRRQDHYPEGRSRDCCPRRAARYCSTATTSPSASARTILSLGLAHCPEGRHVFPHMTVAENLEMGCYLRTDKGRDRYGHGAHFRSVPASGRTSASSRRERCRAVSSRCLRSAARLMSRPKLIMFDEPSLGLAPNIVERTFDIITGIRARRHDRAHGRAERFGGVRYVRSCLSAGIGIAGGRGKRTPAD